MAKNEVFDLGDNLALPVTADTPSGSPVVVGHIVGVAATKEGEGGNVDGYATVVTKGVYNLTVTGAVASVGLPVYITSAYALNVTASGNQLFGHALDTKGAAASVIRVKIAAFSAAAG